MVMLQVSHLKCSTLSLKLTKLLLHDSLIQMSYFTVKMLTQYHLI